jgi:hypothetical protein
MTILFEHNEHIARCDRCKAEQYGGTLDLIQFLARLLRGGWRVDESVSPPVTICPKCCKKKA